MRDHIEKMLKPNKSAANIEKYDKVEQVNTNHHRPLLPQWSPRLLAAGSMCLEFRENMRWGYVVTLKKGSGPVDCY